MYFSRMMKNKLLLLFLLLAFHAKSQVWDYSYRRSLPAVKDQWHQVVLPDDIYGKINSSFSDIRILGVKANGDSIEAPYLLQSTEPKLQQNIIPFRLINRVQLDNGYYYTFELNDAETPVSSIQLSFNNAEFDWRVNLEGSNDQLKWYQILNKYRITAIKNPEVEFRFSTLSFSPVRYRYFRLFISSETVPLFTSAHISLNVVKNAALKSYPVSSFNITDVKKEKKTVLYFHLPTAVPVSCIKFFVHDTFDYYRPFSIEALTDSIFNGTETVYQYAVLYRGTLNSLDKTGYFFNPHIGNRFRILIENHDNIPLQPDSVNVLGYQYVLTARFTEAASYFVLYGKKETAPPKYDLDAFAQKIPDSLTALQPGPETLIKKADQKPVQWQLFENKIWLWIIISLIIVLLGWFTLKMMKQAET